MYFKSDNTAGISPGILSAIIDSNTAYSDPYGTDELSEKLACLASEIFEKQVFIYLVSTGTAANALGLSALVPPHGSVVCHRNAHIYTQECGAFTLFTGGAKTVLIDGAHGKIDPLELDRTLSLMQKDYPLENRATALSITQATERGTLYSIDELERLTEIARHYDLKVHMDGARFSNAAAAMNVRPAEITWKAGIDVLSLGATKNGALAAEAILFFDETLVKDFEFRQKRTGQLYSKNRFFAAQMIAFFQNDLWLKNAQHANLMAKKMLEILQSSDLAQPTEPVQINEIFVRMPSQLEKYLRAQGAKFYTRDEESRFVTSFQTSEVELKQFGQALASLNS